MNTSEYTKALEASLQTALREIERLQIEKAVAEHNLHFFALGRYTFCYRVDKRNVLEISSSIRHPDDKHDPHVGRVRLSSASQPTTACTCACRTT